MKTYKDFYKKTIESHNNGLKLVLGGTGLGKSYGIIETVLDYANLDDRDKKILEPKRKFIYMTNRHNLLVQMEVGINNKAKEIQAQNYKTENILKIAYLKSNLEIIKDLRSSGLQEFIKELMDLDFFAYSLEPKKILDLKLDKLVKTIDESIEFLDNGDSLEISANVERSLQSSASELFSLFKYQLKRTYTNNKSKHQELLKNEKIWQIFPYIEFEQNDNCQVLLATTHKLMLGFFNGTSDIKLSSIENKIIFLDEFDFLYADILKLLCNDISIQNPVEFVRIFYERAGRLNFWQKSEQVPEVANTIEKFTKIIEYIDDYCEKNKIDIFANKDFRFDASVDDFKNEIRVIYQSKDLITPKPIFLTEKDGVWYIHYTKPPNSKNPRILFNIITIAISKILGVFNYNSSNLNFCNEIIKEIWNKKNDNQAGAYEKFIKENLLYFRNKNKNKQNRESNQATKKDIYELGFSLTSLITNSNSYDARNCDLSRIELLATPENIIAKLSDGNLLFGLSATADIYRNQRCFDINWLKQNANYIETQIEDYELIKSLKDEKKKIRNTKVNLSVIEELEENSEINNLLEEILKKNPDFFSNDDSLLSDYKNNNAQKTRKIRLSKTLNTIDKCLNSDKTSHLIFLTTFKQIKSFITDFKNFKQYLQDENYFQVLVDKYETINSNDASQQNKFNNNFFKIRWNERECDIIFLDAQDVKKLESDTNKDFLNKYKSAFDPKKKGENNKTTIVITQYNSASNGINLPAYDGFGVDNNNLTDFKGLHLIEENFFWFDDANEDENNAKNIEKQAFWYLTKLSNAGQISSLNFKESLSKRNAEFPERPDTKAFNKLYKKTNDKTLNAIALYHQAIGRIERKKTEIAEVDIGLDKDILQEFYTYLTEIYFKNIRTLPELDKPRDEYITSALIVEIQEKILAIADQEKIKSSFFQSYKESENIISDEKRSKEFIAKMLSTIADLNKGILDKEQSQKVKEDWEKIREFVLEHSFDTNIDLESTKQYLDLKRDLCFDSKFIGEDKILRIKRDAEKLEIKYDLKENSFLNDKEYKTWNLDFVYKIVNQNTKIKNYFEKKGYKTAFQAELGSYISFFTPYIYQAILQGAVGERAIEALLLSEGIELENKANIPDFLFEVIDAKVNGTCIYLDFKNYSEYTLSKFSIPEESIDFDPIFDSDLFIEKLIRKYELLQTADKNPILYVVNLYSSGNRGATFLDAKGKQLKDDQENLSAIRILPSALDKANPEQTTLEFQKLIGSIKNEYAKK